jgi:ABC-type Zn2+ transport system substrate-binding protein/surface adhesin
MTKLGRIADSFRHAHAHAHAHAHEHAHEHEHEHEHERDARYSWLRGRLLRAKVVSSYERDLRGRPSHLSA